MTPEILLKIMPFAGLRASSFAVPLASAMDEFGILTAKQQAAFMAQIAHESGSLKYTKELADGSAYEGRADLGNTQLGDGVKYRGRGLIQITGKSNYIACGKALGLDLINHPELLEEPIAACRSAAWFWKSKSLNMLADTDKFGTITKIINGGFNGLDDRLSHWLRARGVLGL